MSPLSDFSDSWKLINAIREVDPHGSTNEQFLSGYAIKFYGDELTSPGIFEAQFLVLECLFQLIENAYRYRAETKHFFNQSQYFCYHFNACRLDNEIVNASRIQLDHYRYIATGAPSQLKFGAQSSGEQYLKLLKQHNVKLVVALDQREKYWEEDNQEGPVVERELYFENHRITQLVCDWPDGGPPKKKALDLLLSKMEQYAKTESPIAVHCFAGLGRTGTLIATFEAYNTIKSGCEVVNPFRSVVLMRLQRMSMVQTPEQYASIVKAAKRHFKALKEQAPPEH
ncbi:MAG: dual specificity protein phosphatase family protein [Chlamydiales bacterium]|nr:dual specificity protein phosphatase family protein [Chlamydiia bacterium]MCP5506753.1 dual specificity protein phosphatase family protein [Chlamydiales bacterium]